MATPRQETSNITPSLENYLEAIYEQDHEAGVRVTDIATMLNVSKASVHRAMHNLKEMNYVQQERYGTLKLTEEGKEHARGIARRHHMIKRFLVDVLLIDEETADEDACRMEHVISQKTMEKWSSYVEKVLAEK